MTGVPSQLSTELLQHSQRWENAQKTKLEATLPPQALISVIPISVSEEGLAMEAGGITWGMCSRVFVCLTGVLTDSAAVTVGMAWEKVQIHDTHLVRRRRVAALDFPTSHAQGCGETFGSSSILSQAHSWLSLGKVPAYLLRCWLDLKALLLGSCTKGRRDGSQQSEFDLISHVEMQPRDAVAMLWELLYPCTSCADPHNQGCADP
ncbi:PREDICTED: uncharacterized protein LOC108503768 [Lepidothrix coronata]|uniref:Uncharacterized protein LOC108503768 n=1 Tax=Lepidothrix coronata TaxID=321398 RepID=A0A6J0IBZ4_9PASS|nr:PREDICTED: uncharacterized protein LOC108503768 [Lepidothrix coronata]